MNTIDSMCVCVLNNYYTVLTQFVSRTSLDSQADRPWLDALQQGIKREYLITPDYLSIHPSIEILAAGNSKVVFVDTH